jgi:hypothetical protein
MVIFTALLMIAIPTLTYATAAAIVSIALTVASIAYQQSRMRKLKSEMDKRKQVNVAIDGEPFYLPIVYGRAKVSGGKVRHKLKDSYVYSAESDLNSSTVTQYSLTAGSESYFKEVTSKTSNLLTTLENHSTTTEVKWGGVLKNNPNSAPPSGYGILLLKIAGYLRGNSINSTSFENSDNFLYIKGNLQSSSSTSSVDGNGDTVTTTTKYYQIKRSGVRNKQIFTSGLTASAIGSKNEYLFAQQAICYGGINRVIDIVVDDKNWNDSKLQHGQRIVVDLKGGSASSLATANGFPTTNTFTNTAFATMCFRLNRDDYNYNGSPNVNFFVEGLRLSDILYDSATDQYYVSTVKSYTNNPALVLYDYLTNTVYGKGLDPSFIDLKSFFIAKVICATTIATTKAQDGRVNGRRPDVENEDGTITVQPSIPDKDLCLYECNTVLDSERSIRENIELILESMEEADLIWSGGTYKLSLQAPRTQEDLEALVVATIDEDDIIRGKMELEFPDSSTRYSQVTARFMNEFENFVDDTVIWPTAYSDVYNQYLTEDSDQLLKTEIYLPCTSDPYHALAKAEQMVRTSRREMRAKFIVGKIGLLLEPGDVISVTSASNNLTNEIMKVESIKLSSDLSAEIEARQYSQETFAWNVSDDVAYFSPKIDYYYSVVPPSNVVFTTVNPTGLFGVNSGKLTWTYPDTISVSQFLVEVSSDAGVTWKTLSTTGTTSYDITALNSGTYQFSVRSVNQLGRYSTRVIAKDSTGLITSFTIQRATTDQVAVIYANTDNAATNTQSYTLGTNGYVAYYVYSGDTPTLPVRANITFAKFVGNDGATGAPGYSTAVVTLYAKGATAPTNLAGSFTYTFSTKALAPISTASLGSWSQTIPALVSGDYLWVRQAVAYSNTATDVIDIGEWSTAVTTSYLGTNGGPGVNGLNSKPIFLYRKTTSTTAPASFTGEATYDFSTDILSGLDLLLSPNTWSRTAPSIGNGEYLWVRQAIASSSTTTASITITAWSTAAIVGVGGNNGANGGSTTAIYISSASQPTTPTASLTTPAGWSSTVPVKLENIWVSLGKQTVGGGNYTWDTPSIFSEATSNILVNQNKLPWTAGTGSDPLGWSANGTNTEQLRQTGIDPYGGSSIIWKAINGGVDNDADGGFNGPLVSIDQTKTYRFSLFMKQFSTAGYKYLGLSANGTGVLDLGGTTNTNAYFFASNLPENNKWYLVVGYLNPLNSTITTKNPESGIWDLETGNKVSELTDYRMATDTTQVLMRSYQYYNTTANPDEVWMWNPRIDVVATDTPSVTELLRKTPASYNTAVVSLYAKGTTVPTSFSGTATYTFATKALTGLTLGSWSTTLPTGMVVGEYLWTRQAIAYSNTATDTIDIAEWSTAVATSYLGTNGNPGAAGANGLNSKPIFLYRKTTSSTTPASFTGSALYTFATDDLSSLPSPNPPFDLLTSPDTWTRNPPSLGKGEYLWVRQAIASSSTTTATIPISAWSTAAIVGIGGSDGVGIQGNRGAGWWRANAGSIQVNTLTQLEINQKFDAATQLSPIFGDRFILATTHVTGTTAYIYNASSLWEIQTAFIDGNLLVNGTVTSNSIATGAITATNMAANSITAANGAIANLSVDRIKVKEGAITVTTNVVTYPDSGMMQANYNQTASTTLFVTNSSSTLVNATYTRVGTLVTVTLNTPLVGGWYANYNYKKVGSRIQVTARTGTASLGMFTIVSILTSNTQLTYNDTVSGTTSGTMTLELEDHGYVAGQKVYFGALSGTATTGILKVASVTSTRAIVLTAKTSITTVGTCIIAPASTYSTDPSNPALPGAAVKIFDYMLQDTWATDKIRMSINIKKDLIDGTSFLLNTAETAAYACAIWVNIKVWNIGNNGTKNVLILNEAPYLLNSRFAKGNLASAYEANQDINVTTYIDTTIDTTIEDNDMIVVEMILSNYAQSSTKYNFDDFWYQQTTPLVIEKFYR